MCLQSRRNKVLFVLVFTLLHMVLSVALFLWSFSTVMGNMDNGAPLAIGEELIISISDILLWPIFIPLGQVDTLREILPAWAGIFILILNSLVWALVGLGVVLGIQKVGYRRRIEPR